MPRRERHAAIRLRQPRYYARYAADATLRCFATLRLLMLPPPAIAAGFFFSLRDAYDFRAMPPYAEICRYDKR